MRAAHAFGSGTGFEVDFDLAVTRHKLNRRDRALVRWGACGEAVGGVLAWRNRWLSDGVAHWQEARAYGARHRCPVTGGFCISPNRIHSTLWAYTHIDVLATTVAQSQRPTRKVGTIREGGNGLSRLSCVGKHRSVTR